MTTQLPSVDGLIALAKNDPEGLERLRLQQIEEIINAAPKNMQRRLRGLQFQIDARRGLHKNPMSACLTLSKMMMDSLNEMNDALHGTLAEKPVATKMVKAPVLTLPIAASH